jgi:hypothetical protein
MGYGRFVEVFENRPDPAVRWVNVLVAFLLDPQPTKDFRVVRLQRLIVHLLDLIEVLDGRRLTPELRQRRDNWRRELRL